MWVFLQARVFTDSTFKESNKIEYQVLQEIDIIWQINWSENIQSWIFRILKIKVYYKLHHLHHSILNGKLHDCTWQFTFAMPIFWHWKYIWFVFHVVGSSIMDLTTWDVVTKPFQKKTHFSCIAHPYEIMKITKPVDTKRNLFESDLTERWKLPIK